MKWLTFKTQLEPGFRINLNDIILLIISAAFTAMLYFFSSERGLFLLPLYIGSTFFLFCNVFRIAWWHEIVWYVPFILTAYYAILHVENFWLVILFIFEPLKVALIIYSMKKGPYVGWLYRIVDNYEGKDNH